MAAVEKSLVAISRVPANSGHPLHKGTPREAFIRKFLQEHLPANLSIGSGEIIDYQSIAGHSRNQFDIVIYKNNYPKLDFGGGVNAFLIESVVATIEVKSTLDQGELQSATKAAHACKGLTTNIVRSMTSGYIPPKALNYVVAYDGPAKMKTVAGWLPTIHGNLGITIPPMPPYIKDRQRIPSPALDGVFVLEKGFLYFDNVPIGFSDDELRKIEPDSKWILADASAGSLLMLFLFIQTAVANLDGAYLNPSPYVAGLAVDAITVD